MAQWGKERGFVLDDRTTMRVIATVDTGPNPFAAATGSSTVSDLVLTNVTGDVDTAVARLEELKRQHVGKPYAEWGAE